MENIKHPFNYENKELCALCKGSCCKTLPGQYSPEDFKEPITYELVKRLLLEGKHAIDWFEGDGIEIYYLRPKTINGGMIDPSWGGVCINLTEEGCSLTEEVRPLQCRMLKPRGTIKHRTCNTAKEFGKEAMAKRWSSSQSILSQLVIELKDYGE